METNRSLILSLIKEDLRCNKLVLSLSGLCLDAGKYHTELSTVVFNLMGIDHNDDRLVGIYFDCIDKATEIEDVEDQRQLQSMAEEVYKRLEAENAQLNISLPQS